MESRNAVDAAAAAAAKEVELARRAAKQLRGEQESAQQVNTYTVS